MNKTLKGPGNRFKNVGNSRVSFADSMKITTNLITSGLDGKVAKDFLLEEGKQLDNFIINRQ